MTLPVSKNFVPLKEVNIRMVVKDEDGEVKPIKSVDVNVAGCILGKELINSDVSLDDIFTCFGEIFNWFDILPSYYALSTDIGDQMSVMTRLEERTSREICPALDLFKKCHSLPST